MAFTSTRVLLTGSGSDGLLHWSWFWFSLACLPSSNTIRVSSSVVSVSQMLCSWLQEEVLLLLLTAGEREAGSGVSKVVCSLLEALLECQLREFLVTLHDFIGVCRS